MTGRQTLRFAWSGFGTACRPRTLLARWERHPPTLDFGQSRSITTSRNIIRFSGEEDAQIVRMRKIGNPWALIGSALGRSESSVYGRWRYCLAHHHPDIPPAREIRDQSARREQIFRGVKAGKTFVEIGREFSPPISSTLVQQTYYAACAPSERTSGNSMPLYTATDIQTIESRIAEGFPILQIATELNRTTASVYRTAYRAGFIANRRDYKPYNPADLERLNAMKQSKHSWAEIAAALGRTSLSVARKWAYESKRQLVPSESRSRWTTAQRSEMIRLFDDGLNMRELATHFKTTQAKLNRNLREQLRLEGRPAPIPMWTPWSAAEDEKLSSYRAEGLSYARIAALMPGRTINALRRRYSSIKKARS